jgi:hypothetical protein
MECGRLFFWQGCQCAYSLKSIPKLTKYFGQSIAASFRLESLSGRFDGFNPEVQQGHDQCLAAS